MSESDNRNAVASSRRIAVMALFCSVLLVLAHAGQVPANTTFGCVKQFVWENVTFPVACPFFSIVSGYFLARHVDEPEWYGRQVLQRVRTLVVPFFLWSAVFFAMTFAFGCLRDLVCSEAFGTSFVNCFGVSATWRWRVLGVDFGKSPLLVPLWYVRALFVFFLLSAPVVWFARRFAWRGVAVMFFFATLTLWGVGKVLPMLTGFFTWTLQIGYLWFFLLGITIRLQPVRRVPVALGLVLPALALVFLALGAAGVRVLPGGEMLNVLVFEGLRSVCMISLVWCLMPTLALPGWLSSGAFAIYVLHCLFIGVWDVLLGPRLSPTIAVALKFAMGVVGPIALRGLIMRECPRMGRLAFGSR